MTQSVARTSWLSTDRLRTSPAILRTWSVAITVLLIVVAALASIAARQFVAGVDQIDQNTGPVLISTQGLVASLAEADSANTAVFLSGANEDRQQRRLYESALSRAPQQMEDISSGIGDDEVSHDSLKSVSSQLANYATLVERARLKNLASDPTALDDLESSLQLVSGTSGMLAEVQTVTFRTQDRFDRDVDSGGYAWAGAIGAIVVALLALVFAQNSLRKRTKRLISPSLLLATLLMFALGGWLLVAQAGRVGDLGDARTNGYDQIALTAQLQTAAFDYKTQEARAIIGGDPDLLPSNDDLSAIDRLLAELEVGADSDRESSAIDGLQTRWERYVLTGREINADMREGDLERARARAIGDGNRDFNGFNTTVEGVLLANRDQFNASVDSAANRLNWLQLGSILLPLLAALLTLAGYQTRINEYW